MTGISYKEINSIDSLPGPDGKGRISHYVFQYIDFNEVPQYVAAGHKWSDCFFFGCTIPHEMQELLDSTNLQFPRLGLPYSTFRGNLYTAEELYEGFDPDKPETFATCRDTQIYDHYTRKGKQCNEIRETLGRSLHDRAIEDSLADYLSRFGATQIVAIMGGHALRRTDPEYRKIALISKDLTEKGKLMASGGGPGAMEATHLGAWMAGRPEEEMDEALGMLEPSPTFRDSGWLSSAFKVRERFPQKRFRQILPEQHAGRHIADHSQRRNHLFPRLRRHPSGNLPGRRTEPLQDCRPVQPDGVPRAEILG